MVPRGGSPNHTADVGIDMGRLLAATAARDRAACRPLSVSGTAFVAQGAVGRSENGGGSRCRLGMVLEKREHSDSNKALKVQIPADGALTLIADVSLIKTMWSNAVGQGGHMEERPKKSVTVGTRPVLDGRINRKEIRIG